MHWMFVNEQPIQFDVIQSNINEETWQLEVDFPVYIVLLTYVEH